MDFFQFEKMAYEILEDYKNDNEMYFWNLQDAFKAANMVFAVNEGDRN